MALAASGKKIVNEIPGVLRVYDDGSVDRAWTGPAECRFLFKPVPPHHEFKLKDGVTTRDIVMDPNTKVTARIYIPEMENPAVQNDKLKLPLILHFHGGGFCISQPDFYLYHHFYSRIVRTIQAVCVSVYLPLAPENKLLAAFDTAHSAFLWVRAVARGDVKEPWLQEFVDFGRVFLMGDSSGGTLVHHVAARAGNEGLETEPMKLAGAVELHPGFVTAKPCKSFIELEESALLTHVMVEKLLLLALPQGSTLDHPFVNPLNPEAAPPLSTLNLPPLLVVVGEKDLLRDWQLDYCAAMKAAGKDVEILLNEGMSHCFYLDKMAMETYPEVETQVALH